MNKLVVGGWGNGGVRLISYPMMWMLTHLCRKERFEATWDQWVIDVKAFTKTVDAPPPPPKSNPFAKYVEKIAKLEEERKKLQMIVAGLNTKAVAKDAFRLQHDGVAVANAKVQALKTEVAEVRLQHEVAKRDLNSKIDEGLDQIGILQKKDAANLSLLTTSKFDIAELKRQIAAADKGNEDLKEAHRKEVTYMDKHTETRVEAARMAGRLDMISERRSVHSISPPLQKNSVSPSPGSS